MLTQNQSLIPKISVSLTPFNNKNAHQSDRRSLWQSGELILNFCSFGGIYYQKLTQKKAQKKQAFRLADTKFVSFERNFMDLNKSKNSPNENHSHISTKCRYCNRDTVVYSAGTGIHSLRADCSSCRAWWWIGKIEAHILIESGILQSIRNNDGKQLSLNLGGDFDA